MVGRWPKGCSLWLAAAVLAWLAASAMAQDLPCAQCHAPAGAMYLGQLAAPGAPAGGCPVLDGLGRRLRAAQERLLGLERELAAAARAGRPVGPSAAALARAQGRLAWAQGRQMVSAAQVRADLAQVERLLQDEVAAPLMAQARRASLAAGLGLGLAAGLGLLLAWLVGRRRALAPPAADLLAASRQGRLA